MFVIEDEVCCPILLLGSAKAKQPSNVKCMYHETVKGWAANEARLQPRHQLILPLTSYHASLMASPTVVRKRWKWPQNSSYFGETGRQVLYTACSNQMWSQEPFLVGADDRRRGAFWPDHSSVACLTPAFATPVRDTRPPRLIRIGTRRCSIQWRNYDIIRRHFFQIVHPPPKSGLMQCKDESCAQLAELCS